MGAVALTRRFDLAERRAATRPHLVFRLAKPDSASLEFRPNDRSVAEGVARSPPARARKASSGTGTAVARMWGFTHYARRARERLWLGHVPLVARNEIDAPTG